MTYDRHAKWRDSSFQFARDQWMPEVFLDVIEGSNGIHMPLIVSERIHEKIKWGEIVFPTRDAAKEAAYVMVAKFVQKRWGISEKMLDQLG
ncbi:MAG: hypothetical protein HY050_02140 [Actinobacteria bacterium]|nr:hypothetical protein [Actinomycetota bacterium]